MPKIVSKPPSVENDIVPRTTAMLLRIAQAMVCHPGRVTVEPVSQGETILLILCAAPDDIRKLVGPEGRTVQSLRTILYAISRKTKQHFELEIRSDGVCGYESLPLI